MTKKQIAEAIRNGATVRVTDKYSDVHQGVIVGGNARDILMNIGGDEGRHALIEKRGIKNIEVVSMLAA